MSLKKKRLRIKALIVYRNLRIQRNMILIAGFILTTYMRIPALITIIYRQQDRDLTNASIDASRL